MKQLKFDQFIVKISCKNILEYDLKFDLKIIFGVVFLSKKNINEK